MGSTGLGSGKQVGVEGGFLRILMIRLSAVGDVVRTLPALTCLRRAHPGAHITWAVEQASREILQDQPDLDELLVFPRRELRRALLHPSGIDAASAALSGFLRGLRQGRFDVAIDFQGTFKSGLISRLSGAPRRVGPGRGLAREMAHLFYTDRVTFARRGMSRVERALALLAHLGIDTTEATSQIPERAEDRAYVESFLAALPREPGHAAERLAPAVIFPGTSRTQSHKRYPPGHFARAADLLGQRTGSPVVVAWGPGEEELAAGVIAAMRSPATLAPSLTLGQLTSLIRRARVFLAGDTGPMHIAWTVGTPVVAVYGPTDPVLNRPGGEFSEVAYRKVFCSPCRNRGCIARTCLEDLPPDAVAARAETVIARAEAAALRMRESRGRGAEGGAAGPRPQGLRYDTMGPGARPTE